MYDQKWRGFNGAADNFRCQLLCALFTNPSALIMSRESELSTFHLSSTFVQLKERTVEKERWACMNVDGRNGSIVCVHMRGLVFKIRLPHNFCRQEVRMIGERYDHPIYDSQLSGTARNMKKRIAAFWAMQMI
mmetsp:Transcript_556/g.1162  ORF Transcript_556/g.1162 Transcript_556/m.1162 type:complete len:133 (+) Transcript_556:3150-3548(+)